MFPKFIQVGLYSAYMLIGLRTWGSVFAELVCGVYQQDFAVLGANYCFRVKQRTTGVFLLVLARFGCWEGGWALDFHSAYLNSRTQDPRVGPEDRPLGWGQLSLDKRLKTFTNTLNPESTTESLCNQNVLLSPFLFHICCNCPKACLKVNKLQSSKAPCFRSLCKRQYVKSKRNVQKILCKQSAESV